MPRSTKIVATLGPSSSTPEVLGRIIVAGADVMRLNFSHGTFNDHRKRVELVVAAAAKYKRVIGIMADLQGPKIRVRKFAGSKILMKVGQSFILDTDPSIGDSSRVGLDYPELLYDVVPGDILLLDDGRIRLQVAQVLEDDGEIHCTVLVGGELSNNKGINKLGGGLSAPALTAKDLEDIKSCAKLGVDYVAVSFPKRGEDIHQARELLRAAGSDAWVIAKIERAEAIDALEEIVEASDGIMVARGDLAVEVGDAAVPALQKRMIRLARERNKLAITATQMMESMINSPVPTRAEVSDVANAMLDGTDAVMLSAETAAGNYPVETVEAMARVCEEAEKSAALTIDRDFLDRVFTRIDFSIAMATLFTAYHLKVKAVATITESGYTALWMSRLDSGVPIYALTGNPRTRQKLSLFRDTFPLLLSYKGLDRDEMLRQAEADLVAQEIVVPGDIFVLTYGELVGKSGATNTMKLLRVGDPRGPVTV